ncbi:hypothetical protein ACJ41O_007250 [Fusarium nematophilum]
MATLSLSSHGAILAIVLLIVALSIKAFETPIISRNGSKLRRPPGTLPLVGNGLVFLQHRQKLFTWFADCIHRYGHETLQITVPSLPPGVIISSPINLDYVFRNEEMFEKGEFFKGRLRDLFGSGILNVDGALWRPQRKAGQRFFTASNINRIAKSDLPNILDPARDSLEMSAQQGTPADLEPIVHEITTQLIGKMAYGMEMHATDDFTVAFDYASTEIARRFQNPLWVLREAITGSKLRRAVQTMKTYGRYLVSHAASIGGHGEATGSSTSENLVDLLFENLGDEALVADSALNYLSAGKDTVAQALTWAFYLLTKHQDATNTLLRSIHQAQKTHGIPWLQDPEHLNPATVPYVYAVFYESLRLYPPLPFEIKQNQQDTVLPDGTFLPKNSIVVWCTWAMNRSRETWGEDAAEFRPERWLTNGQFCQRSTSEFPVFQGGPRSCLGKRLAETIAVRVIMVFTDEFEFSPAFEGEKATIKGDYYDVMKGE